MRTTVVIIGAGQAGLAVSHRLASKGIDHVVLERGRTAERWMSQRWDSLRLLSPNWMTRLPGWSYRGDDADGFMSAVEVAAYLQSYAASFGAPIVHGAAVRSVRRHGGRYLVSTDAGTWAAEAVVIATGFSDRSFVPSVASDVDLAIHQVTPDRYRRPADVPDGGVLVVGASATGVQLADELAAAGRDVVLAVGRHTRLPRRYRGRDIFWWLDGMGVLDRRSDGDPTVGRAASSLQIVGSSDGREVDLPALTQRGIRSVGRVLHVDRHVVTVAPDLPTTTAEADARLDRLLDRIDRHAVLTGQSTKVDPPYRPRRSTGVPGQRGAPPTVQTLDLRATGIRTVIWATGYRRRYPWLHVPILDAAGEIKQNAGRTPADGLMVVGQYCQTRRSSSTLDGVRHDAALVVDHLVSDVLRLSTAGVPAVARRAS